MTEFPDKMTAGELYGPAMELQTQAEADEYFARLVRRCRRCLGKSQQEAEATERQNLGYWAGYYGCETRFRVERLFACEHPVSGPISAGRPTPKEAINAGIRLGIARDGCTCQHTSARLCPINHGARYRIGYFLGGRVGVTASQRRTWRGRAWRLVHCVLSRVGISR